MPTKKAIPDSTSDIIVVGAGPAGLSFCRALAGSGLSVTVFEKHPLSVLQDPPYDGREIALTHLSRETMQELGMWARVPEGEIYKLRDARVLDGGSSKQLHFPQPSRARGKPADSLGFLISNHNIRRAAWQEVETLPEVTVHCDKTVRNVQVAAEHVHVTLDDGSSHRARLIVAADSRFSDIRHQLGIPADMHDFGRTVIVFRMRHTESNEHTAFECFHYGRTLALLPLEEKLTNCVVTLDSQLADDFNKQSPEMLAAEIEKMLEGRLGTMTLASSLHTYPLIGMHARRFHGKRSALVGDAAVGMHPVTAHGFNLGLKSAALLAKLLTNAHRAGRDIGSASLLEGYTARHMLSTRPIYHGTNFVVKLFTNETPPARLLRQFVVRASDHLTPLKKLISHQLTG